jgi:hypothetical protein
VSSRLLLTGILSRVMERRTRKIDGKVFGVGQLRDTDKTEVRNWTLYANDAALIDQLERLPVGSPLAIVGPFSITIRGTKLEPRPEFKITAEAVLDTKRRPKTKRQIREEQGVVSSEDEQAPTAGGDPNDGLDF